MGVYSIRNSNRLHMMRILIANVVAISIVATASASAEEPVMGPRRAAEASDEGEVAHLRTRASGGKATAGAIDGGARGLRGGKNRGKGAKSGKGGAKSGKGGAKSGKGGGGGGLFGGMLPENLCIVEPCPHHLSVLSSICGCSEKGETCVPDEEGDGTWGLCVASSAKSGKAGGGGGLFGEVGIKFCDVNREDTCDEGETCDLGLCIPGLTGNPYFLDCSHIGYDECATYDASCPEGFSCEETHISDCCIPTSE